MKDIKVKEKFKSGIKTIDKSVVWTSKVKDSISDIRDRSNMLNEEKTSIVEYADNKIEMIANKSKNATINSSKKVLTKTKDRMIKNYKNKKVNKIKTGVEKKIKDKTIKQVKDTSKNIERARKFAIKTKQATQKTAKVTARVTKKIIKAMISFTKSFIAGVKSLVALLGTGGVIAIIVVILICLIGLLCSSMFGIFFSNESNSRTMSSVISQINNEIYEKAEKEQLMTPNSEIVVDNTVTNWKEVIAVYSVKYANDKENDDIIMYINEKLNEFNEYIRFRKVAVIGLGVSNLPLLDYLHDKKANVTIFDDRTIDELSKDIVDKITNYGFTFSFGKNSLEKLNNFDLIFRSPSCLPTKPELEKEAQRGAIVTTEIELLMKMCPAKIIGVTGSDGKTTTTSLINAILKDAGYNTYLGGNIGTPLFTKLEEMKPEDVVVLELSSFQLMGMEVSPHISVITNITPNHLNI